MTYNIKKSAISQDIVCLIYSKNKCNKSKMLHLCKLKGFHLDIYEMLKINMCCDVNHNQAIRKEQF